MTVVAHVAMAVLTLVRVVQNHVLAVEASASIPVMVSALNHVQQVVVGRVKLVVMTHVLVCVKTNVEICANPVVHILAWIAANSNVRIHVTLHALTNATLLQALEQQQR